MFLPNVVRPGRWMRVAVLGQQNRKAGNGRSLTTRFGSVTVAKAEVQDARDVAK